MLLLTQGPWKPKRILMLEAGRLLRIRGTKKGLNLVITIMEDTPFSRVQQSARNIYFFDIAYSCGNKNSLK